MRIFLSHSDNDLDIATLISQGLDNQGHEVLLPMNDLLPGEPILESTKEELFRSDALVVLWSQNAIKSANVTAELGFMMGKLGRERILSVILDDAPIPRELVGIHFIRAKNRNATEILDHIVTVVGQLEGRIAKKKQERQAYQEKVEKTSEKYISESLQSLEERENKYRKLAYICYVAGFFPLFLGFSVVVVPKIPNTGEVNIYQAIQNISYLIILIGFLAATARYSFMLGRSFMVESLRNSDRIHAIKFGEFYLKTYADNLEWEQLKEAFQYWNIDSGSNFKDQDEKSVDPQILKSIVELINQTKAKGK